MIEIPDVLGWAVTIIGALAIVAVLWYALRGRYIRMGIAAAIVVAAVLLAPTPADATDPAGTDDPTAVGQLIERQYNWTHAGRAYSLTMQLDADAYATARNVSRGTTTLSSYAGYLTPNDPAVRGLADSISALGGDPAIMALSFVRSLDYRTDMAAYGVEEYPQYPIETLVNGYGDCEDFATLYVSVMQALGRDAALLAMLDTPVGGHMAAGIAGPYRGACVTHNGTAYYYAETTAVMDIGAVPPSLGWDPAKVNVLGVAS
jgi:transglutaminase-like putative cysteine protease